MDGNKEMKSLLRYRTGPDDASAPPAVVPLEVSRREAFHGGKQISGASLNAIARHNETLRKRVTDIVQKSSEIVALRGEFIEAADEMGRVLAECETTHAALVERNAMLQRCRPCSIRRCFAWWTSIRSRA